MRIFALFGDIEKREAYIPKKATKDDKIGDIEKREAYIPKKATKDDKIGDIEKV